MKRRRIPPKRNDLSAGCRRLKILYPAELIKPCWIRPEDVPDYEAIGIDCLKLVERFRGTESLIHIVNAYEKKSYSGNLVELLSLPQQGAFLKPNLEVIHRTDLIDPEKMEELMAVLREPFPEKVTIDNSKLNDFLDPFKKIDCFHMDCDRCGHCDTVASQAISIDEEWRQEMISRFGRATEVLVKGEMAGVKK